MIQHLPLKRLHWFVFICILVFIGVQICKYFAIDDPNWIFNHLNDFLVIPIVATLCLHGVWIIKKDKSIRLDLFSIISLVLLFSILFEFYLPQKSHRYTADFWDVCCYFLGGVTFYFLQKME